MTQIRLALLLLPALLAAGCRTPVEPATVKKPAPQPAATVEAPTTTRGEFTIEAGKLDTWNAVGQIAVRTPGVEYEGRAQMLDLYVLRYRGVEFLVLTRWESLDAIRAFAGDDIGRAVVEPGAVSALVEYDPRVQHYDVLETV